MIIRRIDRYPTTYPRKGKYIPKKVPWKKCLSQGPVNCPNTKITVSTFTFDIFSKTVSNQMIRGALEPPRYAL